MNASISTLGRSRLVAWGLAAVLAVTSPIALASEAVAVEVDRVPVDTIPIDSSPVGTASAATFSPSAIDIASVRALILHETNTYRAQHGLPALRLDPSLTEVAQDWSERQAAAGVMSHRAQFWLMYPSGWSWAGENVAAGFSPADVTTAWYNSSGHQRNMLKTAGTDIGIGVATSPSGWIYYTQDFGAYASAPSTAMGTVTRLAGPDRYTTSVQISARTFASGVGDVYVASALDFPDALSAASVAGASGSPLLLVDRSSIPAAVQSELRRLAPDRIIIVGGSAVITPAVESALASYAGVVMRVGGANRYETSRRIVTELSGPSAQTVFLATGSGFADALAAGPAAANHGTLLLINGAANAPDAETLDVLTGLDARTIVLVGGTAVISASIESVLLSEGYDVQRIAGSDRYDTARLINAQYFPAAASAYIAVGTGFADALGGAAAAGAMGAPLYTSLTACLPTSVRATLFAQSPDTTFLLGGFGALGPAISGFHGC